MSGMYSCFGVGAFISPFLIGALVDKGVRWSVSCLPSTISVNSLLILTDSLQHCFFTTP